MKKLFLVAISFYALTAHAQKDDLQLWYKAPAANWTEALPVGNGRLGGMVFGNYQHETIQLNEESVWAGSKFNDNNPGAKAHLPEIQRAIFKGEYTEARSLSDKCLVGVPPRVRSYQPLGNLFINYHFKGQPSAYKRSLDLNSGIATTAYTINGNSITQQVFSSAPNDVMMISITATQPMDADFLLSREFDVNNENRERKRWITPTQPIAENDYKNTNGLTYYTGQIIDTFSANHGPAGKHMRYAAAIKILSVDGKVTNTVTDTSAGFQIRAAKKIVLLLTGATNYNFNKMDLDPSAEPLAICKKILSKASAYPAVTLQQAHEKDHRSMFNRVAFSFGPDSYSHLSTAERLELMQEGKTDNGLLALYYQYGRYLLMGSSRKPGHLPANLQGIWNDLYDAPWNADFHTNINLQMNYWPAETGNLSETSEILGGFMQRLAIPGAATAKNMYGARGWTIHHLTDAFGRTGVMDGVWGITPMDGAWMTFPVFEHFLFTRDNDFLKNVAYPLTKGAVEFVLDFLIKSPEGYLVTNPSHSPENTFFVPGTSKKEQSQMTYAPTVDIHIINALFNNFKSAATMLGTDAALKAKVIAAQKQLPPLKVAANGTLQEWIEDYEEVQPGHRHISHLLGLYPLNLITPKDPIIYEAAKKTLARRLANGGGHTGWSKAWIVSLYARLQEPELAVENLNGLIRKSTLPNLFDTHPPFQIDGNFGGAAAITEMLLQSQNGAINLLPALPAEWPEGLLHGIRARGACTVDLDWKAGKLTSVFVRPDKTGTYELRYKDKTKTIQLKAGKIVRFDGSFIKIN